MSQIVNFLWQMVIQAFHLPEKYFFLSIISKNILTIEIHRKKGVKTLYFV